MNSHDLVALKEHSSGQYVCVCGGNVSIRTSKTKSGIYFCIQCKSCLDMVEKEISFERLQELFSYRLQVHTDCTKQSTPPVGLRQGE
jgi:hypothetical protein